MYDTGTTLYRISGFIERVAMAVALLQPQQHQGNWFFVEFEDDGGIYEVEVDMVGFMYPPLSVMLATWSFIQIKCLCPLAEKCPTQYISRSQIYIQKVMFQKCILCFMFCFYYLFFMFEN